MSQYILERAPITAGLKAMLQNWTAAKGTNNTDMLGEVGEAPRGLVKTSDGKLINPYWIIYPMPTFEPYGDLAHPESGARLAYQITSVGRTDESCQIMSDLIRRGILERSATGEFVRAIAAGASMSVIDRRAFEFGFLTPEAGRWTIYDTYILEVQAHA